MGVRKDLVKENRELRAKLDKRKKRSSRKAKKFLRKNSGWLLIAALVLLLLYGVGFRYMGTTTWHPPVDPGLLLVAFVLAALGAMGYLVLQAVKK